MELPESIKQLVENFERFQGIGGKSALRMALAMSNWGGSEIHSFATSVSALNDLGKCSECGFFADENICAVCSDEGRVGSGVLCVVENITDFLALEQSGQFDGVYHILGGVLSPLMGIGPNELNLDLLSARVKKYQFESVILAINPSVEGDATCSYIKDILPEGVRVQRIGFGVPIGGSLEYLDTLTIAKALENRTLL